MLTWCSYALRDYQPCGYGFGPLQAAGAASAKEAATLREQLKVAIEERDAVVANLRSAGSDGGLMEEIRQACKHGELTVNRTSRQTRQAS